MVSQGFKPSIDAPADPFTHPLIRFRGKMKNYQVRTQDADNGARQFSRIELNFIDVVPLEVREPYPFPIATITIPYSERAETAWAAAAGSMRKVLPQNDIDLLVDKEQEWSFTSAKLRRNVGSREAADWQVVDGQAWQITWLEGQAGGGTDLMEQVVVLADGKTDQEFYQGLFADPVIRGLPGYQDVVSQAANRTLLQTLQVTGAISQDADGVWHKV